MTSLLALVDIDGTLLLNDRYVHGRAMTEAIREVYACDVADDAVMRISPLGKTDSRIAREVAATGGVERSTFERGRGAWIEAAVRRFRDAAQGSASSWAVREDLAPALTEMREGGVQLVPLTGNLRQIAVVKLELMGVASLFDVDLGAYGDEAEDRTLLGSLARRRAGGAADRTWVVGDTDADLATARADGVHCVLFRSERLDPAVEAQADAVVDDAWELADLLVSSTG